MDEILVIPRRFSFYRPTQLKWVPQENGGALVPAVWTSRFVTTWAVTLLVFAGFGALWGWFAARSGQTSMGVAGFVWCIAIWGVIFGIALYGVSSRAGGGAVCELDRSAGVVRMSREGVIVPISNVRLVRSVAFSLERSSGGNQVVHSNQLLLITESGPVHVATQFLPQSAAEQLARAIGVEHSACGAERQDLNVWERAPAWDGERGTRH